MDLDKHQALLKEKDKTTFGYKLAELAQKKLKCLNKNTYSATDKRF